VRSNRTGLDGKTVPLVKLLKVEALKAMGRQLIMRTFPIGRES